MTSLKSLSNTDLDQKLKSLAQAERELLAEMILHIQECEQRRLYLELGYRSLFEYLVHHIGYSEGAAQRRIDAARLSKELPETIDKLESGKISLSQISLIQKACRQKKIKAQDLKKTAVDKIEQKSFADSEKLIAELFDLPVQSQTKIKHQKDDSVRLEITLTKEQAQKLEACKEKLSHFLPDGNLPELLEYLMDQALTHKLAATVAVKRKILSKDQCCQFISPITGKKCESRWQLQVDHKQPRWAGGTDEPSNLQILCAQHNREKYRQQAGLRRI